jgi:hypothetical protein
VTVKIKSIEETFCLEDEEEIISHDQLLKELYEQPDEVWMNAIDDRYAEIQQANVSSSCIIDDCQDALAEYKEDVSDILPLDDIDTTDW